MNDINDMHENSVPESEQNAGGYFRPEEKHEDISDASYTAASEEATTYVYSPGHSCSAVPEASGKKPRRRMSTGAIIAICLICALLAGALGVGATLLVTGSDSAAILPTVVEETEEEVQQSTVKPVLVTSSTLDSEVMSAEEIYEMACEQVVGVTTEITAYNIFGQQVSGVVSGTGFILTDDGYILTNYHVIEDAYEGGYDISVLTHDGTEYAAEVVGTEQENDLAVLKIDAAGLSPVTLGDSNEMKVGQTIYTVGNPLGQLDYTMTTGIVSALDRTIRTDTNTSVNMFQIDAAVNSGNSGGPIYNVYGQVIGIVTAKYSSTGVEGLGFGIPISDAYYIANELITNGYVSGKAYMGVTVSTVSASAAQYYNMVEGAMIQSVTDGSCADKAGLQTGDIITAVGETEITSQSELISAIRKYHAGDTAQLTVFRAQEYQTLSITFDEALPDETGTETSESGSSEYAASGEPGQYYEYHGNANAGDVQEFFNEFFNQR